MDTSDLLLAASVLAPVALFLHLRRQSEDDHALHVLVPRFFAGPWPSAPIPPRGWQPMSLRGSFFRIANDLPPPKSYSMSRDQATVEIRLDLPPAECAAPSIPALPADASAHARLAWQEAGRRVDELTRTARRTHPRALRHARLLRFTFPSDEGAPAHLLLLDRHRRTILSADLPAGPT